MLCLVVFSDTTANKGGTTQQQILFLLFKGKKPHHFYSNQVILFLQYFLYSLFLRLSSLVSRDFVVFGSLLIET